MSHVEMLRGALVTAASRSDQLTANAYELVRQVTALHHAVSATMSATESADAQSALAAVAAAVTVAEGAPAPINEAAQRLYTLAATL